VHGFRNFPCNILFNDLTNVRMMIMCGMTLKLIKTIFDLCFDFDLATGIPDFGTIFIELSAKTMISELSN
jgi:hypothetical protein